MNTKIKIDDIYKDCAYHPTICTLSKGDNIEGISLINGSSRSCSIFNCGVKKISQEEANKLLEAFKKDGERGLMRLNGWNEEDIDTFIKEWR